MFGAVSRNLLIWWFVAQHASPLVGHCSRDFSPGIVWQSGSRHAWHPSRCNIIIEKTHCQIIVIVMTPWHWHITARHWVAVFFLWATIPLLWRSCLARLCPLRQSSVGVRSRACTCAGYWIARGLWIWCNLSESSLSEVYFTVFCCVLLLYFTCSHICTHALLPHWRSGSAISSTWSNGQMAGSTMLSETTLDSHLVSV